MAIYKILYGTETDVTLSADAITTGSARKGTAIDNTSTLASDYLIRARVKTASGSLGTNPHIKLWVAPLSYGGNYADDLSSSDASYTLLTNKNIKLLDIIMVNAANTTQYSSLKSVAALFGGVCPDKFIIILDNQTGLTLAGSANQKTANTVSYTAVNYQSA